MRKRRVLDIRQSDDNCRKVTTMRQTSLHRPPTGLNSWRHRHRSQKRFDTSSWHWRTMAPTRPDVVTAAAMISCPRRRQPAIFAARQYGDKTLMIVDSCGRASQLIYKLRRRNAVLCVKKEVDRAAIPTDPHDAWTWMSRLSTVPCPVLLIRRPTDDNSCACNAANFWTGVRRTTGQRPFRSLLRFRSKTRLRNYK